MATFDQLSEEQRAIIELVLRRKQGYEQLGDMLGMPTAQVQELARSALVHLSPVSAAEVEDDHRGEIADYLLGQQSVGESTATRAHLRRSEAGRAWSRSLLDSLDQFYDPANLPTIPAGDGGAPPPSKKGPPAGKSKTAGGGSAAPALSPEARAIVRRRQIAGGAALAVVVLLAILVWPVGVLTGSDHKASARDDQKRAATPRVLGQLVLKPVGGAQGAGVAAIAQQGTKRSLIIQARLTPTKGRDAYEVWLYNTNTNARSLGAQVTDRQGTYQGAVPLPRDFAKFKYIDVSREQVDNNKGHSGQSVLRGRIGDFAAPTPAQPQPQSQQPQQPQQPQQQP